MHKPFRIWLALTMTLALLFSSGSVWAQEADPPPGSPLSEGSTALSANATPADVSVQATGGGFLYALVDVSGGPNRIYGYQVNELTGALTALSGFPVNTGGNGAGFTVSEQMAYDAANARLYVINAGSNTISAYSVNQTTGALTPLPFSPISLGAGNWSCLAVHPSGSPLVVGDSDPTPALASFNISSTSAAPAAGSPFSTGSAAPFWCAFSRDGNYVYTGGNSGTAFAGFSVNAATGVLTALSGSPFNSGNNNPAAYAFDDAGRLFLVNALARQVRAFTTGGGVPSPVLGNPFASGLTEAVHGLVHPLGYYLVADRSDNRVGVYRISGSGPSTTLTAVTGSPFASGGAFTSILARNRAGTFLFAANGSSRNVNSYSVDTATGALNGVSILPINSAGSAGLITGMAYVPGLNHLYLPLVQR